MEFRFETKEDSLRRATDVINSMGGGAVHWSSIVLFTPESTPEYELVSAMLSADERGVHTSLYIDEDYSARQTIVGSRHVPRRYPFLTFAERTRRRENIQIQAANQAEFASIIKPTPSLFYFGTDASYMRRIASEHAFQRIWPTFHAKLGVIQDTERNLLIVSTGNLNHTPDMLDFSLTIDSRDATETAKNLLTGKVGSGGFMETKIDDNIWLVCDYSNYGEPGRLPKLHDIAHEFINPNYVTQTVDGKLPDRKPTEIIFMSQYLPDGQMANALTHAQQSGSRVIVPLLPPHDHRRRALGYHAWASLHQRKLETAGVNLPERGKSSHNKCLIVYYDDGTAAAIFGSENLMTTMEKGVRNPEASIVIYPVKEGEPGRDIIDAMHVKFIETGELPEC